MTKAERKKMVLAAWDELVGELPEGGESKLPGYAKLYGLDVVKRAIERAADNDSLETSEDVLEGVEKNLRYWDDRGLCGRPGDPQ